MDSLENRLAFEVAKKSYKIIIQIVFALSLSALLSTVLYHTILSSDKKKLERTVEHYLFPNKGHNGYINCYSLRNYLKTSKIEVLYPDQLTAQDILRDYYSRNNNTPSYESRAYGESNNFTINNSIREWGELSHNRITAITPYNHKGFIISQLNGSDGDYWLTTYISLGAIYRFNLLSSDPINCYQETLDYIKGADSKELNFHWFESSPNYPINSKYFYLSVNNYWDEEILSFGGPQRIYKSFERDDDWALFVQKKTARTLIVSKNDAIKQILFLCIIIGAIWGLVLFCLLYVYDKRWTSHLKNKIWVDPSNNKALVFKLPLLGPYKLKTLTSKTESEDIIYFSQDKTMIKTTNGDIIHITIVSTDELIVNDTVFHIKNSPSNKPHE